MVLALPQKLASLLYFRLWGYSQSAPREKEWRCLIGWLANGITKKEKLRSLWSFWRFLDLYISPLCRLIFEFVLVEDSNMDTCPNFQSAS